MRRHILLAGAIVVSTAVGGSVYLMGQATTPLPATPISPSEPLPGNTPDPARLVTIATIDGTLFRKGPPAGADSTSDRVCVDVFNVNARGGSGMCVAKEFLATEGVIFTEVTDGAKTMVVRGFAPEGTTSVMVDSMTVTLRNGVFQISVPTAASALEFRGGNGTTRVQPLPG